MQLYRLSIHLHDGTHKPGMMGAYIVSIYLLPLMCSLIRLMRLRVLLSLVVVSGRLSSQDSPSLTCDSHHVIEGGKYLVN